MGAGFETVAEDVAFSARKAEGLLSESSCVLIFSAGGWQAFDLFMEMGRNMVEPKGIRIAAAVSAAELNHYIEPELHVLGRWHQ